MAAFNHLSVNHDGRCEKHTQRSELLGISEMINLCVNTKLGACLAHMVLSQFAFGAAWTSDLYFHEKPPVV